MWRKRKQREVPEREVPEQDAHCEPASPPKLSASHGANAAGRDVINSIALHAETVLPAEAYAPIPDDAATRRVVRNVPRAKGFVGRGQQLDALDVAFASPGGVVLYAVSGLGGVGKSALAAEWAAKRATAQLRWWITADSTAALDAGLAELARALQPGLAGLPTELQKERAVAWLASQDGWLVVLDNVDHPDHIRPLLDRIATGGRFLITTRRAHGWRQLAATVRLDVFSPEESVELFTQILTHDGPRDCDCVLEVCEEVGHLALAVEQAAAYCHETGTTPHAYLEMLREWPADMFASGPESGDAERTVARIWRLTLDRLADHPLPGQILRTLAWYAPDHIPRELLNALAPPPALTTAIGRLLAYSMITTNPDGTLSVHRLVQTLARTPQPDDPHRLEPDISAARDDATIGLATLFPVDVEDPVQRPHGRQLLPHVDALAQHSVPEHDTLPTSYLLSRTAAFWREQGSLAPAIAYHRRSLAIRKRLLGEGHRATLASRNFLASAYTEAGDLAKAISLHTQNLTDCERTLGNDHPDTLAFRNNLACAHAAGGDLASAIPLHTQNLAACEHTLGNDHPDTLAFRNNLAHAYQSAGDLVTAISLHTQNLTDQAHILGNDHPNTLISRNNLALAYQSAGNPAAAIPLHTRNLTTRTRTVGNDHPDTLISRNNLAYAYEAAGDLVRAIPLLAQNLTDCERILGNDHPHTLASRNNLACAYESAGNLPKALPLYVQTLIDCERILGNDHPDTLASRNNLAWAYLATGDRTRAITLYTEALSECERALGPEHPLSVTVRKNLAAALP